MAPSPNTATDCGTFISIDFLAAAGDRLGLGDGRQVGLRGQVAEHLVQQRAELRGVDVADGDDLQRVLGEDALAVAFEIVARDLGDRLLRAVATGRA